MKKTAGLLVASLLAALTAGIHLFLGGPDIALAGSRADYPG